MTRSCLLGWEREAGSMLSITGLVKAPINLFLVGGTRDWTGLREEGKRRKYNRDIIN